MKSMATLILLMSPLFLHAEVNSSRMSHEGERLSLNGKKVKVEEVFDVKQIPGMSLLFQSLANLKIIKQNEIKLRTSIFPGGERKYYKILELDPQVNDAIIARYKGHPKDTQLTSAVFAFTDGLNTYLLPGFFALSEEKQAALLLREGFWVINSNLQNSILLEVELGMSEWLQSGKKDYVASLYSAISALFNSPEENILIALSYDFQNQRITKDTPLKDLIGEEACSALFAENMRWYKSKEHPEFIEFLLEQQVTRPEMAFYKAIYRYKDRVVLKRESLRLKNSDDHYRIDNITRNTEQLIETYSSAKDYSNESSILLSSNLHEGSVTKYYFSTLSKILYPPSLRSFSEETTRQKIKENVELMVFKNEDNRSNIYRNAIDSGLKD